MTTIDPNRIAHTLEERGLEWADKDAAFKALDDVTKTVLSECMADLNEEMSVAAAETKARRSQKYKDHLKALSDARRESNRAKVNYDTYRAFVDLMRSREATDRAQMTLK